MEPESIFEQQSLKFCLAKCYLGQFLCLGQKILTIWTWNFICLSISSFSFRFFRFLLWQSSVEFQPVLKLVWYGFDYFCSVLWFLMAFCGRHKWMNGVGIARRQCHGLGLKVWHQVILERVTCCWGGHWQNTSPTQVEFVDKVAPTLRDSSRYLQ